MTYLCTMDTSCMPECCAQWRMDGVCANTGTGNCPFSKAEESGHGNPDELFDKCVTTVLRKDGTMSISCKLGLWSCCGRDHEQVKHEARHYWALYHADGEYNEMLAANKERT